MMGRRVYPKSTERGVLDSEAGDYFKGDDGFWYAKTPNGLNANLSAHQIVEHEDKTVSVQPEKPQDLRNVLLLNDADHPALSVSKALHDKAAGIGVAL